MKTWNVYGVVTGTKYLGQVQAETEEEAKEKGLNLDTAWVSLCYQCSNPEIHDVEVEEEG